MVRRQEIVNFMKKYDFKKNLFLYSGAWSIQTTSIVIIIKEGSSKIVNSMTPGADVLVLGRGHVSHIVKVHDFFEKSSLLPGIHQINKV